jgi:L-asparaginase/Glu-tRNA(Gln) amidotransferase subunit D
MSFQQYCLDWIRIATEIELNYNYDAFVILHGTDTMAFTASALSFLLEDLGKTVVRLAYCSDQLPAHQL